MGSSSSPTSTITPTMIVAGSRLSPSSRNGSTLDFPERPSPKTLRSPLTNSAKAIVPSRLRGPSYGRYPRSWMTPERSSGTCTTTDPIRRSGRGRDVLEDVLDAPVVRLDPDQPEAEVQRSVADQVVDVMGEVGGGAQRGEAAPGAAGYTGRCQRLSHQGLRVVTEPLHQQGARRFQEVARLRGAQ